MKMKAGMQSLWKEERGASVVIGAMLMLLVVAVMWGTIQAYHVPNWNKDVEYEHLNMVHDDMMTFKSDVEDVVVSGTPKSSNFRMGVHYPSRMFLANPGTGVAGSLTSNDANVTVEYTLEGSSSPITQTYSSSRVAYEVQGTIDSPQLVYEHGIIIRDYGDKSATTDEQPLITSDQIYIPVLLGSLTSFSSMETQSIEIAPLSQSNTVTGINWARITLDTSYPDVWEQLLASTGTEETSTASDDFESGGWGGGSGWLDDWYHSGDATITFWSFPYEGNYHLLLQGSTSYASRAIDLSDATGAHLQFQSKTDSFESGDEAYCLISSNGMDWVPVRTWAYGDDDVDGNYHYYDIDLSPYTLSSEFWIAFDAGMNEYYPWDWDYFYVDNLEIEYTYSTGAIAQVDLEQSEIIIESTDIRQINFPAGEFTVDALYAGMIKLSTASTSASTSETAVIIGGGTGLYDLDRNSTRYVPMFNTGTSATESDVQQSMPMAGTVSNFYVTLDGSPGNNNWYTFVICKNGIDTPVTCTISGMDTLGSDITNSVSFAAGDYISIRVTPTSNPTVRSMCWTAKLIPSQ
jgi:hypothetical protein